MTDQKQEINYKDTLNLPQTDFKMKANAAVKEPETQKFWEENQIYEKNTSQRNKQHKFILHDGPPYLSSDKIHIGTALNKILKDILVKYKSQSGYYSPYVPGYDGHGLPIENAVVKSIKGGKSAVTPLELREKSREFAMKNLKGQEDNFKRLGVWGDWAHPYITIDPAFEAQQIRVFGEIFKKGYIYKGLKPVYWCASCETALAEAEVEYADHKSHSIYVKFRFPNEEAQKAYEKSGLNIHNTLYMVIWTTTPWTLPANLAISVHPNFEYLFIQKNDAEEVYIIGKDLLESTIQGIGWEENSYKIIGSVKGSELENINTQHPFMDRHSIIILGEHVTTEAGTGAVHTAPGHGLEDYEVGNRYKLGVVSPLTSQGIFTDEAGKYSGLHYNIANEKILENLQENNQLLGHGEITHSYPHCWRCKSPVIYRATEQWFINVEVFRDKALKAIDEVQWIPSAGKQRIYNMVETRSDWCISRQRVWGVPIPVFYCNDCKQTIIKDATIENVARVFEEQSSDAWCKLPVEELLPDGFKCPYCASEHFQKEEDIMDVWFDSGITHSAVVDARKKELCGSPVELYLEGSDQHRGWFQSSLLTSVATKEAAPYKAVLTHGFVLDAHGRKMSKSMGNVIEPQKIVNQYGADVLRLWAASVDYTHDVKIGDNIVQQLVEVYRKVRNSVRFILGNVYDFDPAKHTVPHEKLNEIDRYALHRLQILVEKVTAAFDNYEFYKYYQLMQNYAAIDLSSLYFDIVKDRLYTAGKDSQSRRSSQTVLFEILNVLTRMLVPVTPHLAEDIWQHVIPEQKGQLESILLSDWPKVNEQYKSEELSEKWDKIIDLREIVTKAIEPARANKQIGSSLETAVYIKAGNSRELENIESELKNVFITSQACLISGGQEPENLLNKLEEDGYTIYVTPALGEKCPRCWKYTRTEGEDICAECAEAV